jgi:hypothetical protein
MRPYPSPVKTIVQSGGRGSVTAWLSPSKGHAVWFERGGKTKAIASLKQWLRDNAGAR